MKNQLGWRYNWARMKYVRDSNNIPENYQSSAVQAGQIIAQGLDVNHYLIGIK